MSFVRVALTSELWEGETLGKRVDGTDIFLTSHGGVVHAYEDRCAHLGRPLRDGIVRGKSLICRAHGWEYDATTGEGKNPCGVRLRRFPVRVEQGAIWVDVSTAPVRPRASSEGAAGEPVGPVLVKGPLADAVAAAIRDLNGDVELQDRGGYLRVTTPDLCHVTRDAIEHHFGRAIAFPRELEAIMPSFRGRIALSEGEVVWAKR